MRCPEHGLATAPDGKCVRCRQADDAAIAAAREAARAPARQRGAAVGVVLVVGGLALAAGAIVLPRLHAASGAPSASAASAVATASTRAAASVAPLVPLSAAEVDASDVKRAARATATESSLDRATADVVIVLYCRPGDADCARARLWMLDRGDAFVERNVDVEPDATKAWERFAHGTVPAFDVDGTRFAGFDPDRLANAITYAAAKRLQR